MENFDVNKTPSDRDLDKSIPFDNSVSHAPLDLGGGGTAGTPKIEKPAQPPRPIAQKPGEKTASAERVTGVKTFFTKLHAGAIEFLDEIITKWLKDNPGISIKRTNLVTGEIQGKKTEPNLIIMVWY
jgi:DNA-binding Lrp family transcriptional regulator